MKVAIEGNNIIIKKNNKENVYYLRSIKKVYYGTGAFSDKIMLLCEEKIISVKTKDIENYDTFLDDIGKVIGMERIICIDDDTTYSKYRRIKRICIAAMILIFLVWLSTPSTQFNSYQSAILTKKAITYDDNNVYVRKTGILFNSCSIDCYTRDGEYQYTLEDIIDDFYTLDNRLVIYNIASVNKQLLEFKNLNNINLWEYKDKELYRVTSVDSLYIPANAIKHEKEVTTDTCRFYTKYGLLHITKDGKDRVVILENIQDTLIYSKIKYVAALIAIAVLFCKYKKNYWKEKIESRDFYYNYDN